MRVIAYYSDLLNEESESHASETAPKMKLPDLEARGAESGLNGQVTPILPATGDWYGEAPDAFWGPSVHWNTQLKQYVILLNRAVDRNWLQGGIYLSLTPDIADPQSWSEPLRILGAVPNEVRDDAGWYPQVVGCDTSRQETDREAGERSRLFIHGRSQHYLRFS